jgi:hypothetical protein
MIFNRPGYNKNGSQLFRCGVALASYLIITLPILSQALQPTQSGGVDYANDWFSRFAPNSAADMLNAIPSFSIQAAEEDRGIGRGAENVLINGEQVIGKGTSAVSLLSKIPATTVAKIEVKDASFYNISGLSGLVANVILTRNKIQGTWKWSPEFRQEASTRWSNGELSISGELNSIVYTIGLSNDSARIGEVGREQIFNRGAELTQQREERSGTESDQPELDVDVFRRFSPTFSAGVNITARTGRKTDQFTSLQTAISSGEDRPTRLFESHVDDDWNGYGITVRSQKQLGSRQFNSLFVYDNERRRSSSRSALSQGNIDTRTLQIFNRETTDQEAVFRGNYRYGGNEHFWEASVELAHNSLTSSAVSGEGTDSQPLVLLPNLSASGDISEFRSEIFLNRRYSLGKLVLDGAIGAEFSEVTVSELAGLDGDLSRSFFRPKGEVSATLRLNSRWLARATVSREVEQLDFFNFLGAANFELQRTSGANVELLPTEFWRATATLENQLNKNSNHALTVSHSWFENIVDRRVVENRDAVANIGRGKKWSIDSELTWRPAVTALSQWQFNLKNGYEESSLTDPVTGVSRPFSGSRRWSYRAEGVYQLAKQPMSFGIGTEYTKNNRSYRTDEVSLIQAEPFTFAYATHSDFYGLNVVFFVYNMIDATTVFDRQIFDGFRDAGVTSRMEALRKHTGMFYNIVFQGTF